MDTISYNATLFTNNVGTTGVAMRTPDRRVFFRAEATGLWTELCDADAPNLHLHGRCDIVMEAQVADGNLVLKASRTLQRAA
jgi:hypothetical protein